VDIDGSEEGVWVDKKYGLKGCTLRTISADEARECLRDKTLTFVGDSVTRFQFLSLASFIKNGVWPDEGKGPPILIARKPWPVWYKLASEHFSGSEWCDCFRPISGWVSATTARQLTENRYFHHDSHNVSLNLLTSYGIWKMHGHYPPPCWTAGRSKKGDPFNFTKEMVAVPECKGPQGLNSFSRESLIKARHQFTDGEWAQWTRTGYDWEGDLHWVLKEVIPRLQTDLLFLNFGIWADIFKQLKTKEYADKVVKSAQEHLCSKGVKCMWKRTTHPSHTSPAVPTPQDTHAMPLVEEFGWEVFDAGTPTKGVYAYKDAYHFQSYVYNELNKLLLNQLCPRGGSRVSKKS